ncbi:MAG TPA: hemopexin repeat-containing protein [Solirubrobacteraceae bacterium]|nr:hemopexin repeat-containing protein [Solirubrobacteraceae bacterium]
MLDAMLAGEGRYKGKAYAFRNGSYARFDWAKDRCDDAYPAAVAAWQLPGGMVSRIDDAVSGRAAYEGKAYFFAGSEYARYDWTADRMDPGYPQPLAAWKLPHPFDLGIGTAVNGRGAYEGKAYFFRGDQYVRYDWSRDGVDPGYPAQLSLWKLPAPFHLGIDGAINGEAAYADKLYLFKGDQYVRYDWNADSPDPGYPQPISQWTGLEELLDVGDAAALALRWIGAIGSRLTSIASLSPEDLALVDDALTTHFHVDATTLAPYVATIVDTFGNVSSTLTDIGRAMRFRTATDARNDRGAMDPTGVPYPMYTFAGSSINATRTFAGFGPKCQAAMVLHECVHYVGSNPDHAYEHQPAYSALPPDKAVHNPSSYTCFAQHLFYGADERYGAGRPSE